MTNQTSHEKKDHITVCICTFKRPKMLKRLLKTIEQLATKNMFSLSVILVDNDSAKSAEATALQFISNSNLKVKYFVEPKQNISLARNKAIEEAEGGFLAFIDDDEYPIENWLIKLYDSLHVHKADGVLGPVEPHFEQEPPSWVISGKFYRKAPLFETGRILNWKDTRTSNALVKWEVFSSSENRFNAIFGRGGEDRDFFKRMITKGYVFIWNNEAIVYEIIPPERCSRIFMIKRALLRGKMSTVDQAFGVFNFLKAMSAIIIYAFILPFLLFTKHHILMKYAIKLSEHIGSILAVLGFDIIKQKYVTH